MKTLSQKYLIAIKILQGLILVVIFQIPYSKESRKGWDTILGDGKDDTFCNPVRFLSMLTCTPGSQSCLLLNEDIDLQPHKSFT